MTTWRRHPHTLWRSSGERVVLLAPDADEPSTLSATGALVWHLLEQPRRTDELVAELAAVFDEDAGRIAQETAAFVEDMVSCGAIEPIG